MILKQVLDKTTQFFKEKKIPTARLDAEILLSHTLGFKNRVEIYLKFDRPMSEADLAQCREVVRRRSQGEPVAYILGQRDFYENSFSVGPGVLIPRPETELIVEQALRWIADQNLQEPKILDIGAGTGCIGLSIVAKISQSKLTAIEKSPTAIEYAKLNAKKLDLDGKVDILLGDAQEILHSSGLSAEKFNIVVANPPYISPNDPQVEEFVKKFEPAEALFAEKEGLLLIEQWVGSLKNHLTRPAMVMFEMGKDQGAAVMGLFKQTQLFDEVVVQKDLAGLDRFVVGLVK